jgi:hypothetical protein
MIAIEIGRLTPSEKEAARQEMHHYFWSINVPVFGLQEVPLPDGDVAPQISGSIARMDFKRGTIHGVPNVLSFNDVRRMFRCIAVYRQVVPEDMMNG